MVYPIHPTVDHDLPFTIPHIPKDPNACVAPGDFNHDPEDDIGGSLLDV